MLMCHGLRQMTSFKDVIKIIDGKGEEWVFNLNQVLGMRIREGRFEIEFRGGLADHRFSMAVVTPKA